MDETERKRPVLAVTLDSRTLVALDEIASKEIFNRSQIVEMAIWEYLQTHYGVDRDATLFGG